MAPVPLENLVVDGDMATNWKRHKRSFESYVRAYYNEEDEETKIAILLHHAGHEANDIFDSFELSDAEKKVLKTVLSRFDGHYSPKSSITYLRYKFFTRKQEADESVEQYMAEMRNLSTPCEFSTLKDDLVRDLFICGVRDRKLQERLLHLGNIKPDKALEVCRTYSLVNEQVTKIKKEEEGEVSIDQIARHSKAQKRRGVSSQKPSSTGTKPIDCRYCGYTHSYGKCPAFGKQCNQCGLMNHFATACRAKKTRNRQVDTLRKMESEEDSDLEYILDAVEVMELEEDWQDTWLHGHDWYLVDLLIEGQSVPFKIDSGAQCNVLSSRQVEKLGLDKNNIQPSKVRITSFSKNTIPVVGKVTLQCTYKSERHSINCYVVDYECSNILGLQSSERMGLIRRVDAMVEELKGVPKQFYSLFDGGIGRINYEIKLEVDPLVKPVISPARRIPYALLPQVKEELDRMLKLDIIEEITEPTEWVSQLIVIRKPNGSLRLCLDPRPLNQALKRSHFSLPRVQDIAARMSGARYFCKLDANAGFWMIPLDIESRRLCTFQTKWGRYIFKRLPFGLNVSPEIFHRIVSSSFQGIENVETFEDDIILWSESREGLKIILEKVLEKAKETGMKFNVKKCAFFMEQVTFLGHKFGPKGMEADDSKVKAILALKSPSNKKALQRILGMFNYMGQYIPNYSEKTVALRELLKDGCEFIWTPIHENILADLKKLLSQAPILGFYDASKPLTLSVDASSVGLGAALLQVGKPVAYASKALTEVQKRYSQVEKELLACCFGAERFREYIIGRNDVIVETDHEPLLGLFNKSLQGVPVRLQRMLLKLQPYKLNIQYKPGRFLYVADTLSRDVSKAGCHVDSDFDREVELQVSLLVDNLPITRENWELINQHMASDSTLIQVREYILNGWPSLYRDLPADVKGYYQLKDEFSVVEGLIFKGDRVVIPTGLKSTMLKKLHSGHPGVNRMIKRADMSVFWININQDIRKFIQECQTCLKYQDSKVTLELKPKEVPILPWTEVGSDIFELYKKNFLVIVDAFSNYLEVVQLENLKSKTIINKIKCIFARHGIPLKLCTDGAAYFTSEEFQRFSKEWQFEHIKSSPHYPKSNGLAESAVKTCKRIMTKALDAGEDYHLALLNFRNTPKSNVHSPASLLMGRNLRTTTPCTFKSLVPKVTCLKDRKILIENKKKTKQWHDKKATVSRSAFSQGQEVMFKKHPKATWSPARIVNFGPGPNSYVIETENGSSYVRNEIHLSPKSSVSSRNESQGIGIQNETQPVKTPNTKTTKYGRSVQAPRRLITEI
uniref:RNA-directed DNA polymerase n=1 Tax=Lygus hesperus TaxID=30085 RepID=A0A146LC45_LYGHE